MHQDTIHQLKLDEVIPSKHNPRKHFPEDELKELAASIKDKGLIQPITVRKIQGNGHFEIVAGERRWRASKIAGIETIRALVVELDDKSALEIQVIENLHRSDIHPLEEAAGYKVLMANHGYDIESLAAKVGKDRAYIRERLQLTNLTKDVQKAFFEEKILLGHALAICRVAEDQQKALLTHIGSYHPTVRELNEYIRKDVMVNLDKAPFDLTDMVLYPEAGACTKCPYNSNNDPDLFGDKQGKGWCTKPKCFRTKLTSFLDSKAIAEKEKGNEVLSQSKSREIFRWGMLYDRNFVLASGKNDNHPKHQANDKLFPKLKVYFALDEDNKLRRLFKRSDVTAAEHASDWYKQQEQSRSSANTKERRERRRDKIASNLLEVALLKKIEKDASIKLLAAGVCSTLNYYGNFDELVLEIDPSADTEADYNEDEMKQFFLTHITSLKTEREQIIFMIRLLMHDGYDFEHDLRKLYGLNESKFKTRAAQLEAKEWKAAQAKAKKDATVIKKAKKNVKSAQRDVVGQEAIDGEPFAN